MTLEAKHTSSQAVSLLVIMLLMIGVFSLIIMFEGSVEFADPALEQAVRNLVRKHAGSLRRTDVLKITHLSASARGIGQLDGIENLRRLSNLDLSDNELEDLRPLKKLTQLKALDISRNHIEDLSPISGLTALRRLNVRDNEVRAVQALAALTTLERLNLRGNEALKNLNGLENLLNLRELNARDCDLECFESLAVLMSKGGIQEKSGTLNRVRVDIRGNHANPLPLIPFWPNISYRLPWSFSLNAEMQRKRLQPPSFSQLGGFYSNEFPLVLSHEDPEVKIIYTVDGSDPVPQNKSGRFFRNRNEYPDGRMNRKRHAEPRLLTTQ